MPVTTYSMGSEQQQDFTLPVGPFVIVAGGDAVDNTYSQAELVVTMPSGHQKAIAQFGTEAGLIANNWMSQSVRGGYFVGFNPDAGCQYRMQTNDNTSGVFSVTVGY